MTERPEADPWLTYAQAAEIVGVHKNTLRAAVRRGDLPVARASHTIVRMLRSDLDAWVRGHRVSDAS
jgi:excisionase family DNA binding protein